MDKVEKFKTWLTKQGAVVQDPTNPYELVRFRTENGVSVVYTGKRGITFTNESEDAYERFKQGKSWKVISRKRKNLRAKKARLAARDGKRCFIHGEKMNFDKLTIEHILNLSHGGSDNDNNLCLACEDCQRALGNLPITKKIEKIMELRKAYLATLPLPYLDNPNAPLTGKVVTKKGKPMIRLEVNPKSHNYTEGPQNV